MYYHIYCKTDCPYCKEAIDFLDENKEKFVVKIMDKCPQFERVVKESAEMKTVPIVMKQEPGKLPSLIGGCSDLKESYGKEGV